MNARTRMNVPFDQIVGLAMPATHSQPVSGPQPATLFLDLAAVDRLSCALSAVRLDAPHVAAAGFDALKGWAERLSIRITYLLEQIGPLEFDPAAGTVLIRSTVPDRQSGGNLYYEVLLQSHGGSQFALRRYRADRGQSGRAPVDMHLTHEVVEKLVNDVIDTMP